MINAEDGYHLWSERYDRELTDIFAIQDEIASAISKALEVTLSAGTTRRQPNLAAYEALLKGRHHRQRFTRESHSRAAECFRQAIALDPSFATPHLELAMDYLLYPTNGVQSLVEIAPLIRAEAVRALELEPADTTPRFLLGAIAAGLDYDWQTAAEHFRVAMANPTMPSMAHWAYASFYLNPRGDHEQTVVSMRKAVDQDPLHPAWRAILAHHLTDIGQYDEAIRECHNVLDLDANYWIAHVTLGFCYLLFLNRVDDALRAAERAYASNPHHSMTAGLLASALVRTGQADRAQEVLRAMGDVPSPIWGRVEYHLFCGEIDEAAHWYKRMIDDREPFACGFSQAPFTRPLRESAHWPVLAGMMNLAAAGGRDSAG